MRWARSASCGALVATAGCLESGNPSQPFAHDNVAVWDFTALPGGPTLSLHPPAPSAPPRFKRHLMTNDQTGPLRAQVSGPDPAFIWKFEEPQRAAVVSVDLDAEQPGNLQVFWNTARCPTFREECSVTRRVEPGRRTIEFLIGSAEPVRELRLDLEQTIGYATAIHAIRVREHAELHEGWRPNAGTTARPSEDGLQISATSSDPWLVATTGTLPADGPKTLEVSLTAPAGSQAQLFWQGGPCAHFSEACSVRFQVPDGGAVSQSLDLGRVKNWEGVIRALRLDPGDKPGRYVLHRLRLSSR